MSTQPTIFKRKLYDRLLEWKKNSQGHSAVLIEGSRRVGKSTLALDFAKREYESYLLIDFAITDSRIIELFDHISDLDYFFLNLLFLCGKTLTERNSVIIFDEVQKCPKARQAIKYLVADGRYDYIETGSLISIRQNVKDIVIPSEEHRLKLLPMDYEEFRWALGDSTSVPLIKTMWEKHISFGAVNQKLMRDFRLYMLIGGMPQAVSTYITSNDFSAVDAIKREIISLYEEDFSKIDPSGRIARLFDAIPSQLNSNASRYQISSVIGDNTSDDVKARLISELEQSMTVNIAHHVSDPGVGMPFYMDMRRYKIFLADTGLFVTLAFMDKDFTENAIYGKLLSDKLGTNLGYLYENMVAQMLTALGDRLFYYTFPTETGRHNYEVDFLLSRGNKICPIEVKSSDYKRHVSLDRFCEKFSSRVSNRYVIYTKDVLRSGQITYLPIYLTLFL